MNRFFILFLVFCLVLCTQWVPNSECFASGYQGKYYFYTSQDFDSQITQKTQNGKGYIISCDISKASVIKKSLNKNCLYGESFFFKGGMDDINTLLNNLDIFYKTVNDMDIIAYSPKIDYQMTVKQKIYNVQISNQDGLIYVGFPAILGSF